jgi:peptide/nickel transport system permease protein
MQTDAGQPRKRHLRSPPLPCGNHARAKEFVARMLAYVIRRLFSTLIVMGIVGVFVFLLLHLSPGDPAAIIAGDNATPDQIDGIRKKLGLDDPLLVQFWRWASLVLQGDLGVSIFSNEPVLKLVGQRLEPTVSLALTTLFVAVTLAVTFGVLAAWKAGTWVDRLLMVISVVGFSVPVFVVGYMLIYLFAIELRWLPVQGYTPLKEGIGGWARNLVLPSVALGLAYVALIARITRASMLDVLSEDYIRTARAKGVANTSMLLKHALKNAGVPIVTVIGIGVALLISGVVITETVFNIPGIGRLVVDAIAKRDYPIIQGVILIFSGVYVLVNLAVDLSYTLIDPRIRY